MTAAAPLPTDARLEFEVVEIKVLPDGEVRETRRPLVWLVDYRGRNQTLH